MADGIQAASTRAGATMVAGSRAAANLAGVGLAADKREDALHPGGFPEGVRYQAGFQGDVLSPVDHRADGQQACQPGDQWGASWVCPALVPGVLPAECWAAKGARPAASMAPRGAALAASRVLKGAALGATTACSALLSGAGLVALSLHAAACGWARGTLRCGSRPALLLHVSAQRAPLQPTGE
jgi:hypothetical protein